MEFRISNGQFINNGKTIKIISGAVHYFRNMPDTWDDIFDKMVACGFNTVETYCAWNIHEPIKGQFTFSGRFDIALFLKKAQAHGLMAIVRPGPYICAEWEFGGLPWWLLAERDITVRCSNMVYFQYLERYLSRLFKEILDQLYSKGGNIIMMQVENEYGYYGDDKNYLSKLVKLYRDSGIDVPLFTSDGSRKTVLMDGTIDGCLPTLNFGSRVEENFKAFDELYPNAPKMCTEMWNGWFDDWGEKEHRTTEAHAYASTVEDMLKLGSMNVYMFIGGTNFGFMNGANHDAKYTPHVTSYDYDALLTESGDVTEKYYAVREQIQKYVGTPLGRVPKNRPKQAYGKLYSCGQTELFSNLDALSECQYCDVPKSMEELGFGYGYVVYKTQLNRDYKNVKLELEDIGDRAYVYINREYQGLIYVNDAPYELRISAKTGDSLYIVCENMGRVNFGTKMMRKKGILGRCLLDEKNHFGWTAYHVDMENLGKLSFLPVNRKHGMSFYKFKFLIDKPCDTFLRTDCFTKGCAILNNFNLGRYWDIGPQRTLFVPAALLKKGTNDLIIFENEGVKNDEIFVEFTDKADLG